MDITSLARPTVFCAIMCKVCSLLLLRYLFILLSALCPTVQVMWNVPLLAYCPLSNVLLVSIDLLFSVDHKTELLTISGLKVIVLGPKGSGKTSFVQSMTDNHPRLTMDDEATKMCSISSIDLCTTIEGKGYSAGDRKLFITKR